MKTKKLKVFNNIFPSINGHCLVELENDLRTICAIYSLNIINDNERFNFKCLSATHFEIKDTSMDYIVYRVKINKRFLVFMVVVSEPCQATFGLPWYVLDDMKWVGIRNYKAKKEYREYPDLINAFQNKKMDIEKIFYEIDKSDVYGTGK